jgi:peptide/nickel transport system permease protein
MGTYVLRRFLLVVPVLLLVSLIVFTLAYHMPGDPARLLMGQNADEETLALKRAELGLDRDFLPQYVSYLGKLVRGDLGISYAKKGIGVGSIVADAFALTARLAVLATMFSVLFGIAAGVAAAIRPYSWVDYGSMLLALLGVSLPVFYLGYLLIVFVARNVGLRTAGFDDSSLWTQFTSLLLPSIALGALSTAIVARLTRSTMLEVLGQDFVRTARAKGLTEKAVVLRHALRNAAIPIVTVVGANLGGLLVGAVLTETVFSLPGLGREVVQAIFQRDRELIAGGVLFMSVVFVLVNLLVDLTYAWFDPRVRLD